MESAANLAPLIVGADDATAAAIRDALGAGPLSDRQVLVFVAPETRAAAIAATSVAEFAERLGVLKQAYLALQHGVAAMRATGQGGSVVFVAAATEARAFDATRQGLRLLTKAAALELGPEGIRVNIVLPGAGPTPMGRPCAAGDIADAVAFVASDRAAFMTGADLVVDGGGMAR